LSLLRKDKRSRYGRSEVNTGSKTRAEALATADSTDETVAVAFD
jgi:hypothetical protein